MAALGVGSGWLGTLLAQNLNKNVGPMLTNQVLTGVPLLTFIQDCLFVRRPFDAHSQTLTDTFVAQLVGILLVTIGSFIANSPRGVDPSNERVEDFDGSTTERLLGSSTHYEYPGLDEIEGTQNDEVDTSEVLAPLDTEDIRHMVDEDSLARLGGRNRFE